MIEPQKTKAYEPRGKFPNTITAHVVDFMTMFWYNGNIRNPYNVPDRKHKEIAMQKKPKMILFEYGHTLLCEPEFDFLRGEEALFEYIKHNKNGLTPR